MAVVRSSRAVHVLGQFQTSCYCRANLARLKLDCSSTLAPLGFRRRVATLIDDVRICGAQLIINLTFRPSDPFSPASPYK